MIQRMSDEQIVSRWVMETDDTIERNETDHYKLGFHSAEAIYIPQLEKMQEEIERLKWELQQSESLHVLKNQNATELEVKIEELKSGWNRTITKHDALVKGLKGIRWYDAKDIYEGDESMVGKEWIKKQDVIALTESENQG